MSAASSGLAGTISGLVRGMAQNPQYWHSFLQYAGNSYEAAKADGADELKGGRLKVTIIYTKRCQRCGAVISRYSNKSRYYFGPQYYLCKKCGLPYRDGNAIELASLNEKDLKYRRRDYVFGEGIFICFAGFLAILWILSFFYSEAYLNDHFLVFGVISFAIPYGIKCLIFNLFFNHLYKVSKETINSAKYQNIKKQYDEYQEELLRS